MANPSPFADLLTYLFLAKFDRAIRIGVTRIDIDVTLIVANLHFLGWRDYRVTRSGRLAALPVLTGRNI
jgi:hypothetical protein